MDLRTEVACLFPTPRALAWHLQAQCHSPQPLPRKDAHSMVQTEAKSQGEEELRQPPTALSPEVFGDPGGGATVHNRKPEER